VSMNLESKEVTDVAVGLGSSTDRSVLVAVATTPSLDHTGSPVPGGERNSASPGSDLALFSRPFDGAAIAESCKDWSLDRTSQSRVASTPSSMTSLEVPILGSPQ
jgi:hypothetical protein